MKLVGGAFKDYSASVENFQVATNVYPKVQPEVSLRLEGAAR